MGHTRLGAIPKSRKWNQVVERIGGGSGAADGLAGDVNAVAAHALSAAERGLEAAIDDPGLRQTFYLLTQVVLAARSDDWMAALADLGITLPTGADLFDLTCGIQDVLDDHLHATGGASDFSEMAQQAAGEALSALAGTRNLTLFAEANDEELRQAIKKLSTKNGFAELGQKFFGRFMAHFLNFYLSRITTANAGVTGSEQVGDLTRFNDALVQHCDESALIVNKFAGQWFSKANFEGGITPQNTARFMAIAIKKLQAELRKQGAGE